MEAACIGMDLIWWSELPSHTSQKTHWPELVQGLVEFPPGEQILDGEVTQLETPMNKSEELEQR